jgi:tetratricopeptide (TPR) repeat protein
LAEAAELDPSHMPTLLALADLQEKLGRPAETVAVLVRVAGIAPGPEALVATWKRVGRLALQRLDDPARAAGAFENALLVDNEDAEAWEGLIEALNRQRRFPEAAACLRQLALTDNRAGVRFDHWMALAALLEGALDDPEGAAAAYEQALELEPAREDAHQALQKVLQRLDDPDRMARALQRYLGVFPQAAAERRRLAELLSGALSQPARAAEEWRVLVSQNPADRQARVALATTLERAGRDREAVAEHLAILNVEALRLESLRALRRLFDRLGERRRAHLALGVLVALGAASPEDERAVREARLRFVPEPRAPLGPGDFDNVIRHPGESHPATALLVAMGEAVSRIFPGRLEDWGARPTDRLPPDDPARALVNIVARAVGVEGTFDVFVSPAGLAQVEAESLSPPALILPAHLLQTLPRQEAMMQIARWLGRLRAGTLSVARLPGKDLALVVAAALRTRDPNYGKGLVPEEALVDTSQKIVKLLPRKQRRPFEQALAAVGKAPALEVERWRAALSHTAYRTAVAVSGDVVGAIESVVRHDRRLAAAAAVGAQELWSAARKNAEVVQLVNFVLGEGLASLQDRLGW